jgi:two-component system sensor histidine kinase HydH
MEDARLKSALQPVSGLLSFDDLLAFSGHDIAMRLNNISTALPLLGRYLYENDNGIDEALSELLGSIKGEVHRAALLLDNFRSLKAVALDLKPTSLAVLIRDCLALESSCHRARLELDVPLGLPVILADGPKLKQVILNLCENAMEAMPAGGTVTVRAYARPPEVCLDIHDRGKGISENVRVFTPFASTKARGSGLGTFVARSIVSAHGGTITYTSKQEEGTTFHLAFPVGDRQRFNGFSHEPAY